MSHRIAALTLSLALTALPALASPIDGKAFAGTIKKQGGDKADPDTFTFEKGRFHSTSCDAYGFKASAYKLVQFGEAWSFTTAAYSDKEGMMSWKGEVYGESLTGTAVWTKSGQAPIHYTFTATSKTP